MTVGLWGKIRLQKGIGAARGETVHRIIRVNLTNVIFAQASERSEGGNSTPLGEGWEGKRLRGGSPRPDHRWPKIRWQGVGFYFRVCGGLLTGLIFLIKGKYWELYWE